MWKTRGAVICLQESTPSASRLTKLLLQDTQGWDVKTELTGMVKLLLNAMLSIRSTWNHCVALMIIHFLGVKPTVPMSVRFQYADLTSIPMLSAPHFSKAVLH